MPGHVPDMFHELDSTRSLHPRARSVFAAVVSDGFLADALALRLRDNIVLLEDGRERLFAKGEFATARIIELEDVAVLFVVSLAIADGGLLRLHEPDRGLRDLSSVQGALSRLRRNGLVEVARDGAAWRVSWGKRALDIARTAGVPLAPE
jgi:hypothetical protein